MIEKILKDTYVTPKVELTQSDYNRLVQTAQMKAKKIEDILQSAGERPPADCKACKEHRARCLLLLLRRTHAEPERNRATETQGTALAPSVRHLDCTRLVACYRYDHRSHLAVANSSLFTLHYSLKGYETKHRLRPADQGPAD